MRNCADCQIETEGVQCETCFNATVPTGRAGSIGEMRRMFQVVTSGQDDWKGPIDTVLEINAVDTQLVIDAIIEHTGSVPRVTPAGEDAFRFQAAGYHSAIGA